MPGRIEQSHRLQVTGPLSRCLALTLLLCGCAEDTGSNADPATSATASDTSSTGGTTPMGASSMTVDGSPPTTPVPDPPGTSPLDPASATPTNTMSTSPTSTGAAGTGNGDGGNAGDAGLGGNDAIGNGAGGNSAGGNTGGGTSGMSGAPNTGGQGTAGENTGGEDGIGGSAANGGTAGASAGGEGGEGAGDGYMPCPTNGDPCAILPLGDSITEGCCNFEGGYRAPLFGRAVMDGKNLTFTGTLSNGPMTVENQPFPRRHEGHGGFTIDGISGQLTDDAIASDMPHIVLLMIGTNDLNGNVDVAQAPNRLGDLVDQITDSAPDALVVVATIIPMVNGNGPKVPPYNEAIADLVEDRASQGKHVVMVDNYAAFTTDPNYSSAWMSDTLHPNTAGYDVLGDSFYDVIGPYLPDTP